MDWTLEVVILPVSDIDASVAFYRDKVGFDLDHDTKTEHMHVVQLTPRGSGCSIVFGDLPPQREMAPGSLRGLQLVVADARPPPRSCSTAAWSAARSRSSHPTTAVRSSASVTPTAIRGASRSSRSARRSR
jgi:catechol 2,3-dioxygenase-like lactoylglutathione lyase family enzyme